MPTPHILEAFLSGDFSSLWPPLAAVLTGAYKTGEGMYNKYKDALDPFKEMQKWAKDYYNEVAPSQMERIRKDIENLEKQAEEWRKDVVSEIAKTVGQGLSDGTIAPQTDGNLGQTRDIFTPDGDVPMDVGTMPGMSSEGGGMDRSGGGSSSSGSGSSTSTGSGGTAGSGSSSGSDSSSGSGTSDGSGTQPPSAGDVGAGPDDFVEYQPGQGQVVITHPDGSQTIKPWPPS